MKNLLDLFSSNVILPSLAYVYLGEEDHSSTLIINALTLSGSACGMVSFGILADIFGRQRLYGVELVSLESGVWREARKLMLVNRSS